MIWIVLVPAFYYLLWLISQDYYAFNIPLFHFINANAPHWEWFWQNVTFLGDGLPAAALLIFFCRRNAHMLWLGILGALITGLGLQICKHVLDFMRPAAVLGVEHIEVIGKALKRHSFPSGHSATAFVLAGVLSHYAKRLTAPYAQLIPLCLVMMATLIAWSRVVVGVHWPMDVMLGSIWGWYSARVILWISAHTYQIGRARISTNLLYGLGFIIVGILWSFDGGYPLAAPLAKILSLSAFIFLSLVMLERNSKFKLQLRRSAAFPQLTHNNP